MGLKESEVNDGCVIDFSRLNTKELCEIKKVG
jgi:hypothetical protein